MILNIIVLGILVISLKHIISTEKYDILCPDGPLTKNKNLCKEGNGKTYNKAIPNKHDSLNTLISKISIACKAIRKDVIWRKLVITSSISLFLIFSIVMRRIPTIYEIVGMLLIMTTVGYGLNNFYNYHHYSHIENNILKSLKLITKKIKNKD